MRSDGLLSRCFCDRFRGRRMPTSLVDSALLLARVLSSDRRLIETDVPDSERVSAVDIACYGPKTSYEHHAFINWTYMEPLIVLVTSMRHRERTY